MPAGALRECRVPRCPGYADRLSGLCPDHRPRDADSKRRRALRTSDRRFRWMRLAFLRLHPMCALCRTAPATDLDHIQPHRDDPRLFWDQSNWQALCGVCHGRKSQRETESRAHMAAPASYTGAIG